MKLAYFPGCATKNTSKEYDKSTRLIAKELGIELIDIPAFSCCGAGVLKEADSTTNTVLNARNFALAEAKNLDMTTICSTCVLHLLQDYELLNQNPESKKQANNLLERFDLNYQGKLKIKHFLWNLVEDYGLENIKNKIKKPLSGLKVATYYGCHIVRPLETQKKHTDPDNPKELEKLVETVGAIPIELSQKTDCCGFHIVMVSEKTSLKISSQYLVSAKNAGADIIITVCPFCQMQFDLYQTKTERIIKDKINIPIIHFTQLIGLALNFDAKALGLDSHFVKLKNHIHA